MSHKWPVFPLALWNTITKNAKWITGWCLLLCVTLPCLYLSTLLEHWPSADFPSSWALKDVQGLKDPSPTRSWGGWAIVARGRNSLEWKMQVKKLTNLKKTRMVYVLAVAGWLLLSVQFKGVKTWTSSYGWQEQEGMRNVCCFLKHGLWCLIHLEVGLEYVAVEGGPEGQNCLIV